MKYFFTLIILLFSLNASAVGSETYKFYDYSGNPNQVKLHPAENSSYWLELAGLSLITLSPMDLSFPGLEFYQTERFFKDPNDADSVGNVFEKLTMIVKRQDHSEFTRALTLFRRIAESVVASGRVDLSVEELCSWDSDAILLIKVAADEAGNPGPRIPFCLKLDN